jgi:tetratricopeptide (TPR) repeat protein
MNQRSWLFLIFSLLTICRVDGQTASETYASALKDEQSARYTEAVAKFQRIMYFKPDTLQYELYMHIGNCLMYTGAYYKAINNFDNALLADRHYEHQNELKIQMVKAFLLARNIRLATVALRDIDTINEDSKKKVLFYQGAILFYLEQYDAAEITWLKIVKNDKARSERITMLFTKNKKINRLKPGVAIALSVILPGAGQIYAGDFKEGINSLLVNGAFFVLGYNTAVTYNLLNALIAVGPWYIRYYQGGFFRAGEIVKAKRAQKHQLIYKQIIEVLEQES